MSGPSERIAGYVLGERVGQGGMAVVYLAQDERLGRRVALKVLSPALAADTAFRERFLREARAAASVDDPHIIPVYEAGDAGGVLYLAMRYVGGGDVSTLVQQRGALPPDEALGIISPVASALDAAHNRGLVHRDVKPANMLLDSQPGRPAHVYLSDFGVAKESASAGTLTGTGHFVGTASYCAPEQINGGQVGGWTDQYALACATFELMTGGPPFARDSVPGLLWAHMYEPAPSLAERIPGLPPAADQVLARAMAKDPASRFATCAQFAEALRAALGLPPYLPGSPYQPAAAPHPATMLAAPSGPAQPAAAPWARPPAAPRTAAPTPPGGPWAAPPTLPPPPARRSRAVAVAAAVIALVVVAGAISAATILTRHHTSHNTALGHQTSQPVAGHSGGTPAPASPTASPTAAATTVTPYEPWAQTGKLAAGITVKETVTGSCDVSSQAVPRSDAYRCTSGNAVFDPCFFDNHDASGPGPGPVACPDTTPDEVVVMKVTELSQGPVPAGDTPAGAASPWFLVLSNGQQCTASSGGDDEVAGKPETFFCSGGGGLYGQIDTSSPVWSIYYLPNGSSSPDLTLVQVQQAYE